MATTDYHVVADMDGATDLDIPQLDIEPLPSSGPLPFSRPRPCWLRTKRLLELVFLRGHPSRRLYSAVGKWVRGVFLILAVLSAVLFGFLLVGWCVGEIDMNEPWSPDAGSIFLGQRPLPAPNETNLLIHDNYVLPLRTKGRDIVDVKGHRFRLSSVNWYGASDELFVPGGLDIQHRDTIAQTIKKLGFNSVRLPYADQMVMTNPLIPKQLLKANLDLTGNRSLDVFDAVVQALTNVGIAVIINNHITTARWCCDGLPCDLTWSNDHFGPLCRVKQSEKQWMLNWEIVMWRYRHNPRVIGADLRNEVRGLWGTMPWYKWATAAEKAGNRLLAINPDLLIVVGGTESGTELSGVAKRPVRLALPNRVVYAAHVYPWHGWGSQEGRFSKRTYGSFTKAMRQKWAYLVNGDIAPVWVNELGGPDNPSAGDMNYWVHLMRYLQTIDADFGYWPLNPRKPHNNQRESYSLVDDDWVTPVLDHRMQDITELIRQSYCHAECNGVLRLADCRGVRGTRVHRELEHQGGHGSIRSPRSIVS